MSESQKQVLFNKLAKWYQAWNNNDLDAVFDFLHDDIEFESWDGSIVKGKTALKRAWQPWFRIYGGFKFIEEETFIDLEIQKALFCWKLEWQSPQLKQFKNETVYGVDILHFHQDRIIKKNTFSKRFIQVGSQKIKLIPELAQN